MNEQQYLIIEGWLKSIDSRLEKIENTLTNVPKVTPQELSINSPGVEKLAKFLKCSEEDVYNIISFESESEFTFLFNFEGKKESEKQLKATLCLLTVLYYSHGEDEIATIDLKKKLEFFGINSLDHLSDNLKKKKKFIVSRGKVGSSKFNYKITQPGLTEGIKFLSEQIKKE